MATLKTSFVITTQTELVSARNGRHTIGSLVDQQIRVELNMVQDNHGSDAMLQKVEITFDDSDTEMLAALYGKASIC